MTATPPAPSALLLDVNQVADLLGCSPRQVWRLADGGDFPRPIKLGMKLKRWPRSALESWIADQSNAARRR